MGIQETGQGIIVTLKARPASGRFALYRKGEDILLDLRSPAREGKANQEIMSELPKLLRCEVQVLRGSTSRKKMLLLKGISREELEGWLATR